VREDTGEGSAGAGMASRILLIDDDAGVLRSLSRGLRRASLEVTTVGTGSEAISLLESDPYDVIVSDLRMPGVDGLDLLRFTRGLGSPPPFILFSAYASDDVVAEALREGAEEFLPKPIDMQTLVARVRRVLSKNLDRASALPGFVADGAWFGEFSARLRRIAASEASVLVLGETGTGKSLVAKALWRLSPRREGPFVVVNCAAIPDQLLESELFGHVKGAFTGATNSRVGRVHQAHGGVLFLDEVGELRSDLQAKLLHVLQERHFQPVGSNQDVTVDVRFTSATNRDLLDDVSRGLFRRDLFYRLNVVRVEVPPLRDRPRDVPVLVEHFRRGWEEATGISAPRFRIDALERMMSHAWPGNVRELQNAVERAAIVMPEGSEVDARALDDFQLLEQTGSRALVLGSPGTGLDLDALLGKVTLSDAVRDFEQRLIMRALERAQGNRSEAARLLGMNRTTLLAKLRRLGLE
jgi:two-component system, NtrC family, response regulator HydG